VKLFEGVEVFLYPFLTSALTGNGKIHNVDVLLPLKKMVSVELKLGGL
jgi:hypothetical protein